MTQGKWFLIHNGLRILAADCWILTQMLDPEDGIYFLGIVIILLVYDAVAEGAIKKRLRKEGKYIDLEDVPMPWDAKGIITRIVGGFVILMVLIAALITPERPISNNIQVLSMDVMASPWFRGGAIVAFSVYFMYIAYESYKRNYASERRKKAVDGYKIRKWEE